MGRVGNPPDSPWRSTPNAARKRKNMTITLSEQGKLDLEALKAHRGFDSISALIEHLAATARTKDNI